jgi:acetate kinase
MPPRTNGKDDQKNVMTIKDAVDVMLGTVTDSACQAISKLSDLNTIGHRALHGGAAFADAVLINENIIKSIRASCDLAPLHNPYNLAGIEVMRRLPPSIPQVAVLTPPSTRSCPVMHIYLGSSP